MSLFLRSLIFTIVAPGMIGGALPLLVAWLTDSVPGGWPWVAGGAALISTGAAI